MEIKIAGKQSFFLKGKKENVLVNPNKDVMGSNKYSARLIVFTENDSKVSGLGSENVIIKGPGEYEVGGVQVLGINAGNNQTVYIINIDGVEVGVIGKLEELLSDKKIERVEAVDVLLAPTKFKEEISSKTILEWAKKWGVNYLVPMDYEEDNNSLKEFLDAADQEGLEPVDSIKIDKDNLPDGLEIVVLKQV